MVTQANLDLKLRLKATVKFFEWNSLFFDVIVHDFLLDTEKCICFLFLIIGRSTQKTRGRGTNRT